MPGVVQMLVLAAVYSLSKRKDGMAPAKEVKKEVESLFGKKVSAQHCYVSLSRLTAKKVLTRCGSSRKSTYYINPEYLTPVELAQVKDLVDGD